MALGTSPISLVHSSIGQLEVMMVEGLSYLRMLISKRYSTDLWRRRLMPMSIDDEQIGSEVATHEVVLSKQGHILH